MIVILNNFDVKCHRNQSHFIVAIIVISGKKIMLISLKINFAISKKMNCDAIG